MTFQFVYSVHEAFLTRLHAILLLKLISPIVLFLKCISSQMFCNASPSVYHEASTVYQYQALTGLHTSDCEFQSDEEAAYVNREMRFKVHASITRNGSIRYATMYSRMPNIQL